ncbi:hypothetical protein DM828_18870 [Pseudomonas umsongensis]|nr:hypothetical protein [Pseudomonas umsongensis]
MVVGSGFQTLRSLVVRAGPIAGKPAPTGFCGEAAIYDITQITVGAGLPAMASARTPPITT